MYIWGENNQHCYNTTFLTSKKAILFFLTALCYSPVVLIDILDSQNYWGSFSCGFTSPEFDFYSSVATLL